MLLLPRPRRRARPPKLSWRRHLPASLRRPRLRWKPGPLRRKMRLWRKPRARPLWASLLWRSKAKRPPKQKKPRLLLRKRRSRRMRCPRRKRLTVLWCRKKHPVMPVRKRMRRSGMTPARTRLPRKTLLRKLKLSKSAKSPPVPMRLPQTPGKKGLPTWKRPGLKRKLRRPRLRPLWRLARKRKKDRCLRNRPGPIPSMRLRLPVTIWSPPALLKPVTL